MTDLTEPIVFPARRRWPFILLGIVVGVVGAIGTSRVLDSADAENGSDAGVELEFTTAPVEIRDLVEQVDWIADLRYGEPVAVAAPADGTVTAVSGLGEVLRRGDVLFEIDLQPVVVLYGIVPAWRDLTVDDEGPDVEQLETNLVALGHDPDNEVVIDEVFDADTEAMIERWQETLGVELTGEFSTASSVVVDGPVSVTTAPRVGDPARSGITLADVSARSLVETVVGRDLGEITSLVDIGADVDHGTLLYVAGGVEVYAATGLVPIEGLVDDGTERSFVLVPEGRQVSARLVDIGNVLDQTRPILELSAQTLSVVVPVEFQEQGDWSVGQEVMIELPDDSIVDGLVAEVGTVAQGGGQGQTPTVDVTIEIVDLVDEDLPASEVTVVVAGESVLGALVVPTRALVTLSEGGFAVEQVRADDTSVLIAVETGTFDDGLVEIEPGELQPGDLLLVPR